MSITIPSWLVVSILTSSVWFVISTSLWRGSNGISRLSRHGRKGRVVKTWPEVLACVTIGPVGWSILVFDYFDKRRSRAARRRFGR